MATKKKAVKKRAGKTVRTRTTSVKSIFGFASKDKAYKRAKVAAKKAAKKASMLYRAALKKAKAAKRKRK